MTETARRTTTSTDKWTIAGAVREGTNDAGRTTMTARPREARD